MGNLHEKAKRRTLKSVKNITTDMLNELDDFGDTVWHTAAWFKTLNYIPKELFTSEALAQKDAFGDTVWHQAAQTGVLNAIPEHLFTEASLGLTNSKGMTLWEKAVQARTLNQIPKYLFTKEILNKRTAAGDTLWHYAAITKTLNAIPKHLFTYESLNQRNNSGNAVWLFMNDLKMLKEIPKHLITSKLLDMKLSNGEFVFTKSTRNYIKNVLEMPEKLKEFIKNAPNLEREIEFKDERLILTKVNKESVVFDFEGYKKSISLTKEGVFMNNEKYKSLKDAVSFIEESELNIEKSMPLPSMSAVSAVSVELFTL